jgi:tetratricopeptide (TPR) repeat protein
MTSASVVGAWALQERGGIEQPAFVFEVPNLRVLRRRLAPHFFSVIVAVDGDDRPFLHLSVPDLEQVVGIVGPFGPEARALLDKAHAHAATSTIVLREGTDAWDLSHFAAGVVLDFSGQLGRAIRLSRAGKGAEALALLGKLAQRPPVPTGVHYELGRALFAEGAWQDALQALDIEIEAANTTDGRHHPFASYPLNTQGVVFSSVGRAADAVAAFEDALRLRPNYIEALLGLAYALPASPERARRVVELVARAQRCCPQSPLVQKAPADLASRVGLGRTELTQKIMLAAERIDLPTVHRV